MKEVLKKGWKKLLDWFFPRLCLHCRNKLREDERYLCTSCFVHLEAVEYLVKEREMSFKGRVAVKHLISCYKYTKGNPIQSLIHSFKYHGEKDLAVYMGERMGEYLLSYYGDEKFDFIIPIPLHFLKQKQRGYNQSEKLSQGIGNILGIPVRTDVLSRRVNTHTQTTLEFSVRYENVKNIFLLENTEGLAGKHILLVDDVYTSGSTLEVASRLLLTIPNLRLSAFALAMV